MIFIIKYWMTCQWTFWSNVLLHNIVICIALNKQLLVAYVLASQKYIDRKTHMRIFTHYFVAIGTYLCRVLEHFPIVPRPPCWRQCLLLCDIKQPITFAHQIRHGGLKYNTNQLEIDLQPCRKNINEIKPLFTHIKIAMWNVNLWTCRLPYKITLFWSL